MLLVCMTTAQYAVPSAYPATYAEGAAAHPPSGEPAAPPVSAASGGVVPDEPAQAVSQIDFRKLRDINQDSVAWVVLEGTVMNYPVFQGRDNDFYLNHLFTGTPARRQKAL